MAIDPAQWKDSIGKVQAHAAGQATPYEQYLNFANNPFYYNPQAGQAFWGDPRMQQAYGGAGGAIDRYSNTSDRFGTQVGGYGQYAKSFLNPEAAQLQGMAAGGGPSYVNQAAAAQRMEAQRAIGQQAAMGSRGGMNPAVQRAAVMQASNVQANMAGQVAAARAQERMQALNQLMQARQAQLGARQSALQGAQNYATMRGDVARAYGEQADRMARIQGGILGTAGQAREQQLTREQNLGKGEFQKELGWGYGY